jgi:hypothetical protein
MAVGGRALFHHLGIYHRGRMVALRVRLVLHGCGACVFQFSGSVHIISFIIAFIGVQ